MNIFRLAGDLFHLLAIMILPLKIWKTCSCAENEIQGEDNKVVIKIQKVKCWIFSFLKWRKLELAKLNSKQHPENDVETIQVPGSPSSEQLPQNGHISVPNGKSPVPSKLQELDEEQMVGGEKAHDRELKEKVAEKGIKSLSGISGRSQILFALVYTTRYLDLFCNFISLYNSVMKIVFIGASYATLYLMYVKFKATYDRNHDTFRIEFLVIPVVILALVVNHDFSPLEVLWTFSIYLESVAILPQLFLVSKTGEAETIILHYLLCLGFYKGLYILNWVYRYYSEGFFDLIAIIAGVVQTVLYIVTFSIYILQKFRPVQPSVLWIT